MTPRATGVSAGLNLFTIAELGALRLRASYAVRPFGALGTCGWIDGRAWSVDYVIARSTLDRRYPNIRIED